MSHYNYKIIEKSYEGIFCVELIQKSTSISILLVNCYLPPENSPYGRNIDGFLSHLEQLCHTYSSKYDSIIFGGDLNARIGSMSEVEPDIDTLLPKRIPLDLVHNSHGTSFIDFLKDCKLCILNGRYDPEFDNFTCITNRGKSVVDYFFCSHKTLDTCSNFQVFTCKELANKYNLFHLIGNRSKLPDHSLIKMTVDTCHNYRSVNPLLQNNPSTNNPEMTTNKNNTVHTNESPKYNVRDIPGEFFTSPESCEKLVQLIQDQELSIENQHHVDRCYNDLVNTIFSEMDKYLPKSYGFRKRSSKYFRVKKPYWNNYLKTLWQDMCMKENEFLKYKGPNHVKQYLRKRFTDSSSMFHKELRKAERKYNRDLQENIESICTENPKQFWNYVKKLGPQFNSDIPEEVYDNDGNLVTNLDAVMDKWKKDYENLYKPSNENFDETFYKEILDLLRMAENRMKDPLYVPNQYLNRNISTDEINNVLDKLKNRKAPGLDNIRVRITLSNISVKDSPIHPLCSIKS